MGVAGDGGVRRWAMGMGDGGGGATACEGGVGDLVRAPGGGQSDFRSDP
jgi:hypothetical protein